MSGPYDNPPATDPGSSSHLDPQDLNQLTLPPLHSRWSTGEMTSNNPTSCSTPPAPHANKDSYYDPDAGHPSQRYQMQPASPQHPDAGTYSDQYAPESSTGGDSRSAQPFSSEITTSADPRALYQDVANARNQGRASDKAENISRFEAALDKLRYKAFIDGSCRDCMYRPTIEAVREAESLWKSHAEQPDVFDANGELLPTTAEDLDILVLEFALVTVPGRKRKATRFTSRWEKPPQISRREPLIWEW